MNPRLAARVRMRWDAARAQHALLAPEAVLFLSGSAPEVLALCDGTRSRDAIVRELEARHPGAPVARDVDALLARLAERGLVLGVAMSAPSREPKERRAATTIEPPIALLAELTYRCPLRCGYCSNPVELARHGDEIDTGTWRRTLEDAARMGVLQAHFSGGEPLLRHDLETLVRTARDAGLYTNLITSAYGLDDARIDALRDAGLDHVQVSFQDTDAKSADAIAGTEAHATKLRAAERVKARGLALSVNVVLHRRNLDHIEGIVRLAESLGAERLELANTQYHGWALRNRDALIPTRAQLDRAHEIASQERARLRGTMDVIYVRPDYYTDEPKPCMDGWGRKFVTVIPDGRVLPCPGAHELPLAFERVTERSIAAIWRDGEAMNAYRGTAWMREPCVSCERREMDFGGCRCQAFALTGDARNADPACAKSEAHGIVEAAREAAAREPPAVLFRVRTKR